MLGRNAVQSFALWDGEVADELFGLAPQPHELSSGEGFDMATELRGRGKFDAPTHRAGSDL